MFKKGELTTEQIVVLVILIISFGVILFFLLRIDLGNQTSEDICHNSVLMKSGVGTKAGIAANSIELQCERQYVCITYDGRCDKLLKPKIIKVKNEDEFYHAIAEEMADCWWMFGEGKLNYVGKDLVPGVYCSICDQLAFDSSVDKIFPGGYFELGDLYDYMAAHNISEGETYSEYLFNRNDYVSDSKSGEIEFRNVTLSKDYYVLTGMISEISLLGWAAIGGAITGGTAAAFALAPMTGGGSLGLYASIITGAKVFAGTTIVSGVGSTIIAPIFKNEENYYILPSLIEVGSTEYNDLGCKEITTSS